MNKAIALLLGLSTFGAYAASNYTFEDLRVLAEQKSWVELAEHIGDIKPSQRNEEWQGWLEQSATGSLETLAQSGKSGEALHFALDLISTYPTLASSDSFKTTFSAQLVEQAQPCVRYSAKECIQDYGRLLHSISIDGDVSFQEGMKVYQNVSKTLSVPFFASAAALKPEYCENSQLAYSLLYTLDLPNNPNYELAKQTALGACGNKALTKFEDHVIESKAVRAALCEHYVEKDFVSGIMKQICQKTS